MNQKQLYNISHVIADLNSMVENVVLDKNKTMIIDNVSVKSQEHIELVRKMSEILKHVLASG